MSQLWIFFGISRPSPSWWTPDLSSRIWCSFLQLFANANCKHATGTCCVNVNATTTTGKKETPAMQQQNTHANVFLPISPLDCLTYGVFWHIYMGELECGSWNIATRCASRLSPSLISSFSGEVKVHPTPPQYSFYQGITKGNSKWLVGCHLIDRGVAPAIAWHMRGRSHNEEAEDEQMAWFHLDRGNCWAGFTGDDLNIIIRCSIVEFELHFLFSPYLINNLFSCLFFLY